MHSECTTALCAAAPLSSARRDRLLAPCFLRSSAPRRQPRGCTLFQAASWPHLHPRWTSTRWTPTWTRSSGTIRAWWWPSRRCVRRAAQSCCADPPCAECGHGRGHDAGVCEPGGGQAHAQLREGVRAKEAAAEQALRPPSFTLTHTLPPRPGDLLDALSPAAVDQGRVVQVRALPAAAWKRLATLSAALPVQQLHQRHQRARGL